jgi:hypothetical protein
MPRRANLTILWQMLAAYRPDRSKEIFCPGGGKSRICGMSDALSSPIRAGYGEMIAQLIRAGYLPSDQRHDPDAITNAIARMKLDLRTGNGSVLGRKT